MLKADLGQLIDRPRREPGPRDAVNLVPEGKRQHGLVAHGGEIDRRRRLGRDALGDLDDRTIARAPTEITGQHLADRLARALGPDRAAVQRHDDARRAEAALRAMLVDHGSLHRMQAVALRQALDRHQRLAMQHGQELDAGVDRPPDDAPFPIGALRLADQDGARAAVALGAPLLGPGPAQRAAQVLQQSGCRIGSAHLLRFAVEQETDHLAHQLPR